MKRRFTLLATLISGLMVASAVEASPMLWLQQLLGMGSDVTTMSGGAGGGPWGYGYPGYGWGGYPYTSDAAVAGTAGEANEARGPDIIDPGQGNKYRIGK